MSKHLVLITGLFLVIFCATTVSIGLADANRRIPWDCSNWAAYAHEDRTTAILETLAENRGRTLYCGIDQSDTFSKAETWVAGRDRNERDDTIYWGERGNFRGFIAAQEGWLTEGESGITGQSTATIFEFPREQRGRRSWKTIRLKVPADSSRRLFSPHARNQYAQGAPSAADKAARLDWQGSRRPSGWANDEADDRWQEKAAAAAATYCENAGYQRATRVTPTLRHSDYLYGDNARASNWNYFGRSTNQYVNAQQINTWSAVCVKRVRGPRR